MAVGKAVRIGHMGVMIDAAVIQTGNRAFALLLLLLFYDRKSRRRRRGRRVGRGRRRSLGRR